VTGRIAPARIGLVVALTVLAGACGAATYRRTGTLASEQTGVYATATTFLTMRGYEARSPGLGPVAVLECTEGAHVDRPSLFETYRTTGDGAPDALRRYPRWSTVRLVAETFAVDGTGRRRRVAVSDRARAHADSLMRLLTATDE
jgi:hypothetical protein